MKKLLKLPSAKGQILPNVQGLSQTEGNKLHFDFNLWASGFVEMEFKEENYGQEYFVYISNYIFLYIFCKRIIICLICLFLLIVNEHKNNWFHTLFPFLVLYILFKPAK